MPLASRTGSAAVLLALAMACAGSATADGWRPPTESDARSGRALGQAIDAAHAKGQLANLHAIVVVRHGALVLERYFAGGPPDNIAYDADTPHDMRSVSKSVVGLLYGIALSDGAVPDLDTPVITALADCPGPARDSRRRRITIEHILSMSTGLAWQESQRGDKPGADRFCRALGSPIAASPGTAWHYTDGATALIAHLIVEGTGGPLSEYAQARLFEPLDISGATWSRDEHGAEIAAYGLRMTPRDLAKIGLLVLNGGQWNGDEVVPAGWLKTSFKPRVTAYRSVQYGLHWYLSQDGAQPSEQITAAGKGGQRLDIFPDLSLAVAITAGNYDRSRQPNISRKLLRELVLPAFER